MAFAQVIKEINSVRSFFSTRDSSTGSDVATLQRSFADGVMKKLSLVQDFGPGEGAQLNELLRGNPFGDTQTQRIADAADALLEKRCNTPSCHASKSTGEMPRQFLKHWWNYCKQSELDFFMDTNKGINQKMTLMVEIAMRIGLTKPTEDSYKWSMAMLLVCHYKEVPSPRTIYDKLQDFKNTWDCEKKAWYFDHIENYPEQPVHLPKQIYEHAYADAEPVMMHFAGINTVASSIPLRRNSKLLKNARTRGESQALETAYQEMQPQRTPSKHTRSMRSRSSSIQLGDATSEPEECEPDMDDAEAALRKDFELKLAQLRAQKAPVALAPQLRGRLVIARQPDGALSLGSESTAAVEPRAGPNQEPVKPEPKPLVKHELNEKDNADAGAAPPVPTISDLDPWTRAAMQSLEDRHTAKLAKDRETKGKTKSDGGKTTTPTAVKAQRDKTAKGQASKIKAEAKIKAEKGTTAKATKATAAMRRPAASMKRPAAATNDAELSKAQIMKAMPSLPADGSNPRPIHYWGGIIYTAAQAKKFRALKERGNNYSEASASWGGPKPTKAAWTKVVKSIADHYVK